MVFCSLAFHKVFSWLVSIWFFSLGVRCSVFRIVIWFVFMVCVGSLFVFGDL